MSVIPSLNSDLVSVAVFMTEDNLYTTQPCLVLSIKHSKSIIEIRSHPVIIILYPQITDKC